MTSYSISPELAAFLEVSEEDELRRLDLVFGNLRRVLKHGGGREPRSLQQDLVRVHREEVAYLLRYAAQLALRKSEAGKSISWHFSVDTPYTLPFSSELYESRKRLAISRQPSALGAFGQESCEALARESLRWVDSASGHLHVAIALLYTGRWPEASPCLERAQRILSTWEARACWTDLAASYEAHRGNVRRSLDIVQSEARFDSPPGLLLFWLWYALSVSDSRSIEVAARIIDEQIPVSHPALACFLSGRRREPRHPGGRKLPALNPRQMGLSSKAVIDAFQS